MSDKIQQAIEVVQNKMKGLILEFAEGKVSNEQFNILYERYNNQLALAMSTLPEEKAATSNDIPTIAIRQATTGKAVGLGIYHHRSGTIIETLGNFDLPPAALAPVLNEFSDKLDSREFIEPRVQKGVAGVWLVFMARSFTTVIVIFRNQPSQMQLNDMQRMHHDFEEANRRLLDDPKVDPSKLARPFIGFVKRKISSST